MQRIGTANMKIDDFRLVLAGKTMDGTSGSVDHKLGIGLEDASIFREAYHSCTADKKLGTQFCF